MDQRNSLKNTCKIYFDKLISNNIVFDKKQFGNKIKLMSRTFNTIFIDVIDINNYKYFIDIICSIVELKSNISYKLGRKIFLDYQIIDICLNNLNLLGKEYLYELYINVISKLFTNCPDGMQQHRDIIDMCKKGYNKTGYIECYYYLAYIINHMCWCCFRPTNAYQIAYKYYQICLDAEYETYLIYMDLIEICHSFIMSDNIDK